MPLFEKYSYIWKNGPPSSVILENWVLTLSQEEQQEFSKARERQYAYRQVAMDKGNMEIVPEGYKWRDEDAHTENKPNDPIWVKYFERWLSEHDGKLVIEIIEVNE
jgi:hypothetical protein